MSPLSAVPVCVCARARRTPLPCTCSVSPPCMCPWVLLSVSVRVWTPACGSMSLCETSNCPVLLRFSPLYAVSTSLSVFLLPPSSFSPPLPCSAASRSRSFCTWQSVRKPAQRTPLIHTHPHTRTHVHTTRHTQGRTSAGGPLPTVPVAGHIAAAAEVRSRVRPRVRPLLCRCVWCGGLWGARAFVCVCGRLVGWVWCGCVDGCEWA